MKGQVKTGRAVASFLFAPVGIFTYAFKKQEDPKAANTYLILALSGLAFVIAGAIVKSLDAYAVGKLEEMKKDNE